MPRREVDRPLRSGRQAEDHAVPPLLLFVKFFDWIPARRLITDAFALWKKHHALIALTWYLADKRHGDFAQLRVRQVRALYKAFETQVRRAHQAGRISRTVEPRLAGYECVGLISAAGGQYTLLRASGFSHQ